MIRKIIGVTVGTPISPRKIEEKLNPVKTVNGISPDENGNVNVATFGGSLWHEEHAGKLVYIDTTGQLVPLTLGAGLAIINGVLTINGGVVEDVEALLSSDGYVLRDSNGLYIIPKESE